MELTEIINLPSNADRITRLSTLVETKLKNTTASDLVKDLHYTAVEKSYTSRSQIPTELTNLKNLLTKILGYNSSYQLLKQSPNAEVTDSNAKLNEWIRSLSNEIILAGSTWPLDPKTLQGPLTTQQQDDVFAKLKALYLARDKTSIDKLTGLKNNLQSWVDSKLLRQEQNNIITTAETDGSLGWIPTINNDILALQAKTGTIPVNPPAGPITTDLENDIFAGLQKYILS